MIVDVKKYLFMGAKEELADFFIRAQDEGCIEFISPKAQRTTHYPKEVQRIIDAIKILRKQPIKSPYKGGGDLHYAEEIAGQVLDLKAALEKQEEEKRLLEAEIARVAPFGNFSMRDISFIEEYSGRKIQFFCVKTSKRESAAALDELIYVGTEYDLDYFIAINKTPRSYPGMIEMHFEHPVGELKSHLHFIEETLQQIHAELKGFAGHLDFLKAKLLDRLDIYSLECAQKTVTRPMEGALFAVEAWVPENKIHRLPILTKDYAILFEPIVVESQDRVPTCMQNKGFRRLGEDLVKLYDIPAATDNDPSGWIFWAFVLFFAIITADGGYGVLFLLVAIFLKFKMPSLKGGAKRLLKMLTVLSVACIGWGFLTSSFFGIEFDPESAIGRYSPIQWMAEKKADYILAERDDVYQEWAKQYPQISSAKSGSELLELGSKVEGNKRVYEISDEFTDNILLEFSLVVGVIHISLSLLRYVRRSLSNLGWVAFAIGGYLYFPKTVGAISMVQYLGWLPKELAYSIGLQLIYIGIGFACVVALIQKGLKGLAEPMQLIHVFSDILSYLRLYALGLAGTIMAHTFNEMGAEINLVLGAIVVLLGHCVTIILAAQGGVIHGLRLNFIEWYHYCFEGDGKLFNPLRKQKLTQE